MNRAGKNNPFFGKHHTEKTKALLRRAHWNKGLKDNPGYSAIHVWVKKRLKKPLICPDCRIRPPYDLANVSQDYKRDITDWEWLCRSCHHLKYHRRLGRSSYTRTPAQKEKISNILRGRIFTEEHRKNISLSKIGKKGRTFTQEQRDHLSKILTGKKRSLESKVKMSISAKKRIRVRDDYGRFLG